MSEPLEVPAVRAYVTALCSPSRSATEWLELHLADGVILDTDGTEIHGKEAVLRQLGMTNPETPTFASLGVSDQIAEADGSIVVHCKMPPLGAAPTSITLEFSFGPSAQISRVRQTIERMPAPREPEPTIPLIARSMIDGALTNGTPMVFTYVDQEAVPHISLRGSVRVLSGTQLSIWLRPSDHSAAAIEHNAHVALLYRDSRTRSTLVIKGIAHVATEPATADLIYRISPEVEQTHDQERKGTPLIIDVQELRGTSPIGGLYMAG